MSTSNEGVGLTPPLQSRHERSLVSHHRRGCTGMFRWSTILSGRCHVRHSCLARTGLHSHADYQTNRSEYGRRCPHQAGTQPEFETSCAGTPRSVSRSTRAGWPVISSSVVLDVGHGEIEGRFGPPAIAAVWPVAVLLPMSSIELASDRLR